MGYLVTCPTCGGKMSSNAQSCPHCGERSFIKYEYRKVKCKCGSCHGQGTLDKYDVVKVFADGKSIRFPRRQVGEHYDHHVLDNDGCPGAWVYDYEDDNSPLVQAAKRAYSAGRYKISRMDATTTRSYSFEYNAYFSFNFRKVRCSDCNGTGYVYETKRNAIDIRKQPTPKDAEPDASVDNDVDRQSANRGASKVDFELDLEDIYRIMREM